MQDNSVTLSRKKIIIIAISVGLVLALLIGSVVLLLTQTVPFSLPGRSAGTPDDFDPFAGVNFSRYIDIGDWQGLVLDVEPLDEDAMLAIIYEELANTYVQSDRTVVQMGDFIVFDFDGYAVGLGRLDGMAAEDHVLEIGSGQFIPGFEEQMVGAVVGQPYEVRVTFPDDYPQNRDLEGRVAIFTGVVHEIWTPATEINAESLLQMTQGATDSLEDVMDELANMTRQQHMMLAFETAFAQAEFLRDLPAVANIYDGPDGEEWAREDLFAFAIAAEYGLTLTQADIDEMVAEASEQFETEFTEEMLLQGMPRAEFVRMMMYERIAEVIFRYAVDADGNSVYIPARD